MGVWAGQEIGLSQRRYGLLEDHTTPALAFLPVQHRSPSRLGLGCTLPDNLQFLSCMVTGLERPR